MENRPDPFSLIAQLTREIRPSKLEEARERERQRDRERHQSPEYRKENRERMKKLRSKNESD